MDYTTFKETTVMKNKILLIEDDDEIRDMVNDYLSGEFKIFSFSSGKSAIQTIDDYDTCSLSP